MSDAWRWLIAGEWRAHPMRFLLAGLAIAVGVALGFAVHVINRSAADAFGEAVRSVSGDADLQVRGTSPLGFSTKRSIRACSGLRRWRTPARRWS
jgi:putative ABC transport system permease protein